MKWNKLNQIDSLNELKELSFEKAVVIFKHSTSCPISGMALNRLERSWDEGEMAEVELYYLDLLSYRDISNAIATEFGIHHQSPQVLVIKDGVCIYDNSHMGISYQDLRSQVLS